ncbi:MAG: histidine phosphatase family protein [Bdellovibrio sp.]|nr:histidine phosphatase family protein [Bdellovibrio sp.]
MLLALVRHGKAADAQEDEKRPLSPRGLEQVSDLAKALHKQKFNFNTIFHSGLLRAEQTAQGLQAHAFPHAILVQKNTLRPENPPSEILKELLESSQSILLVGHMPFMGKLANILGADRCDFSTAGCLVFERNLDSLETPFKLLWERI